MYRTILEDLKVWKIKENRRPLLLTGGVQVGKTWVLNEFGKTSFEDILYIDCKDTNYISYLMDGYLEPERIFKMLEVYHGSKIKAGETLLIFDEIQETPGILLALMKLSQEVPEYVICCTGTFAEKELPCIGDEPEEVPDILKLHPLNFNEFLIAVGENDLCNQLVGKTSDLSNETKMKLLENLRTYFFVGGMPKAVSKWIETKSITQVKAILDSLIKNFNKVVNVSEYEDGLNKLLEAKAFHQVYKVTKAVWPLESYIDKSKYHLHPMDIGIFSARHNLQDSGEDGFLKSCNPRLIRQFVWQELYSNKNISTIYYLGESGELIFGDEDSVVPIQIDLDGSLDTENVNRYPEEYNVQMVIRISLDELKKGRGVLSVPLYALWNL
ncbi:MAG: ATP-binding protein [Clostridiales bacterium]|nr:ATP-binding protein [Clostridiales bacterium]